jgi:hypothetical protein
MADEDADTYDDHAFEALHLEEGEHRGAEERAPRPERALPTILVPRGGKGTRVAIEDLSIPEQRGGPPRTGVTEGGVAKMPTWRELNSVRGRSIPDPAPAQRGQGHADTTNLFLQNREAFEIMDQANRHANMPTRETNHQVRVRPSCRSCELRVSTFLLSHFL